MQICQEEFTFDTEVPSTAKDALEWNAKDSVEAGGKRGLPNQQQQIDGRGTEGG